MCPCTRLEPCTNLCAQNIRLLSPCSDFVEVFRHDNVYRQLSMKCSTQHHVLRPVSTPPGTRVHVLEAAASPYPYDFNSLEISRRGEELMCQEQLSRVCIFQIGRNRYGVPAISGNFRPPPPPEPSRCYHSHYASLPISTNMLTVPPRAC